MKNFIITGAVLLCSLISFNASSQAVAKGTIIIDPYYGAPNFGKKFISGLQDENTTLKTGGVKGLGPMGLRAEYMLADKFGLGVDFIYNSTSIDLARDSFDNSGNFYKTYTGTGSMNRIRVQLRFNYHFVSTDNLDAYFGVGAGSNTRIWKTKSNDPTYDFNEKTKGTLLPVSMRIAVGMRYYFIPNLGLNAEIGLGGPLISAGLSFKI